MKKLLTILLSFCLIGSVLVGCGGSGGGSTGDTSGGENVNEDGTVNDPTKVSLDKDKLVFWSLFSGGDGEYMDKIISDYNASSPTKEVQSVMLVWGDYYTKLATSVAANKGPDIGVSHVSKLPELVEQGIVQSFDAESDAVSMDWNNFSSDTLDSITFDGQKYAAPLDTHAEVFFFNKDIIEEAGIKLNKEGKIDISGVDQFKEILDQAKSAIPDGGSVIALTANGDDPYRVWWATYFQMGGSQIVDGDKVTLDKDIAVKAAEFVKSLYDDGYIAAGIEDHGKIFQGGQSAFYWGGTWSVGGFEQTDNLNFGVQENPTLFDQNGGWADGHVLTIPVKKARSEEDTKAAVEFLDYATSDGAVTWAGSGQIPSNTATQENKEYLDMDYRSSYKEAANIAVLPPQSENFYSMKDAMIKCLDTVWADQSDAKSAIDDMYAQIESNLS